MQQQTNQGASTFFQRKYPGIADTLLEKSVIAASGAGKGAETAEYRFETDGIRDAPPDSLFAFFKDVVSSIKEPLKKRLEQNYEEVLVGAGAGWKPEHYSMSGYNNSSTLGGGSGYTNVLVVTIRMAWSHPKGAPEPKYGYYRGVSEKVLIPGPGDGYDYWKTVYYPSVWVPTDGSAAARHRREFVSDVPR